MIASEPSPSPFTPRNRPHRRPRTNRKGNLITKIFFHISIYIRKASKTSPFPDCNPLSTPFPPQNIKNSPKRIKERREGQNTDINQLNTNAKTRKPSNGPQSIRNAAGIPCKWPPLTKQHTRRKQAATTRPQTPKNRYKRPRLQRR